MDIDQICLLSISAKPAIWEYIMVLEQQSTLLTRIFLSCVYPRSIMASQVGSEEH